MPAYSFCDSVVKVPFSGPATAHETLRLPELLEEAAAQPDLFGKARPDKPWLDASPRIIYVEAPRLAPSAHVRRIVLEAAQSTAGRHHWWLCDEPLLQDPDQANGPLSALPVNVKPVSSERSGLITRFNAGELGRYSLSPNEWLILDIPNTNELHWLDKVSHAVDRSCGWRSAAIFADRPWPFPGRGLGDLDKTIRNAAMLFREVPKWIRKGNERSFTWRSLGQWSRCP